MKLRKTCLKILKTKCEITPLFVLEHKWSQRKHLRVYNMPPCCAHNATHFLGRNLYMQIICKCYSCTVSALTDVCATIKYRTAKTKMAIQGYSRSRVLESVERR